MSAVSLLKLLSPEERLSHMYLINCRLIELDWCHPALLYDEQDLSGDLRVLGYLGSGLMPATGIAKHTLSKEDSHTIQYNT
jgi:hypothetical protein